MENTVSRVSEVLRDLGFGAHEAEVIVALNRLESATVSELSSVTGIHHANLYTILDGLVGKGIVVSSGGRPRVYGFAPLSHLKDLLSTRVNQLIADLKQLQKNREPSQVVPALVYTVRGMSEVHAKMLRMLDNSKNRIMIAAPSLLELGDSIVKALQLASERRVVIRAIFGTKSTTHGFDIQQHIKDDTMAINLVVDGEEAMISMPDLSVCGWVDNSLTIKEV
jgi:sugar-specific transcriptional regulator TrmB